MSELRRFQMSQIAVSGIAYVAGGILSKEGLAKLAGAMPPEIADALRKAWDEGGAL